MIEYGDSTRSVHAGLPPARPGEPLLPGPVFASIFPLAEGGPGPDDDVYGRTHNSTRRGLEKAIGGLEGGGCLTFATGMAAVSAVLYTFVGSGETVVVPGDGYYKTRAFVRVALEPRGVNLLTPPTRGPYPSFEGVRLVLLESPANPGLDVCDIAALAAAAHEAGALVAVDNTTATPLGQRPLDLGADLVVASGTKALTGHSDLLLGYVCARDPDLLERVRAFRDHTGGIPGPFDAWLAHRSLATLDVRLARQTANAAAVAAALAAHRAVEKVRWPGLDDDPSHEVASRQMLRMPGVVTAYLGSAAAVNGFLAASRLFLSATSFGGLHSTADRRAQWGEDVPDGLLRLSCGIEDTSDLVADLTAALDAIS
jgi:cystathionine gamma-lyase